MELGQAITAVLRRLYLKPSLSTRLARITGRNLNNLPLVSFVAVLTGGGRAAVLFIAIHLRTVATGRTGSHYGMAYQ